MAADWRRDCASIRRVRRAVFVEEQGIAEAREWDGRDGVCRHVLAIAADCGAVATGRLLPDGRIGRMAVLPAWRGRGVGRALLVRLERTAARDGMRRVRLCARLTVAGCYARAGYRITGEPFTVAGIDHV